MDLKKLTKNINQHYGEPFLPNQFVRATIREQESGGEVLNVQIGDRDADFDEQGNCLGAGTGVGSCAQWDIVNHKPIKSPLKAKDLLDSLENRTQITIKRGKRLLIINCVTVEANKEE